MRHLNSYEQNALSSLSLSPLSLRHSEAPGAFRDAEPSQTATEAPISPLSKAFFTAACRTVVPSSVFAAFQRAGYRGVRGPGDPKHLSLHEIDRVASGVRAEHTLTAAAAGAVAGFIGAPGLLAVAPLARLGAARVSVETALYYGFEPNAAGEDGFAMTTLNGAPGAGSSLRSRLLQTLRAQTPLALVIGGVALAWVVARATRDRSSVKVLPWLRAGVGAFAGGLSALRASEAASARYRERFLLERQGQK